MVEYAELGPAQPASGACALFEGPANLMVDGKDDSEQIELEGDACIEVHNCKSCVCCAAYSPVSDGSLPEYEDLDICNHTSPGMGAGSSPTSEGSLGDQIERFIRGLRKESDDLDASSPYSQCSRDEIHQVFVDPEEGLVLNLKREEVVVEDKEAKSHKKSQALITMFFKPDARTGSAAVSADRDACSPKLVSTDEKLCPDS